MGIEEGEEVQTKGIHNIFNKIITENFPNTEKTMPIQVQEGYRTPNRPDQKRTTPRHIIIKTTSTETRERILKEIIRDYFESLYSNKFENLEETDRFLETSDDPKLNQEDINHLNRSITQNEIEAIDLGKMQQYGWTWVTC
jgi:hypothetical protein